MSAHTVSDPVLVVCPQCGFSADFTGVQIIHLPLAMAVTGFELVSGQLRCSECSS